MVWPTLIAYLLAALFVVIGLVVLFVIGYTAFWLIRNKVSPVTRAEATVVRRRMNEWDVPLPVESSAMSAARLGLMGRAPDSAAKAFLKAAASPDAPSVDIASGVDYYVTFAFSGRDEEFLVPEAYYIRADEGTKGLLVFQKEQFKHFITSAENGTA
jgi:hypothetical protein